jgi:hypothetical protein
VEGRKLGPDLLARHLAARTSRDQRGPCLKDERLDLVPLAPEDRGDLGVGAPLHLGEHERCPLISGQLLDVSQDLLQVLAGRDVAGGLRHDSVVHGLDRTVATPPQRDKASMAGDAKEPGANRAGLLRSGQRVVRREEGDLHGVLGILLGAEHPSTEREDRPVVADEQRLEGQLRSRAHLLGQGLI